MSTNSQIAFTPQGKTVVIAAVVVSVYQAALAEQQNPAA